MCEFMKECVKIFGKLDLYPSMNHLEIDFFDDIIRWDPKSKWGGWIILDLF